jgi:oxalate decarboxylase
VQPQFYSENGSRTLANADNFPILAGMGAALIHIGIGGVNEPHWHPNAAELCYCISGDAKMTVYSPHARQDTFTLSQKQIAFIPRGYWHNIENIGNQEVKLVNVYNNERPEDMGISGSLGSMPNQVLDKMFGITPPGFFDQLNYKSTKDVVISQKRVVFSNGDGIQAQSSTSRYKLDLGGITPQIQTTAGTGALAMTASFPILAGLALFLIHLKPVGIIEPHTHPNASELNYVINGKVRFTVYGPGGKIESAEISQGQVFFVPRGYFHYLENPDNTDCGMVASFFNNEDPEFIGITGGISAYSDKVLGSVFNKDPTFFGNLPRIDKDIFIA